MSDNHVDRDIEVMAAGASAHRWCSVRQAYAMPTSQAAGGRGLTWPDLPDPYGVKGTHVLSTGWHHVRHRTARLRRKDRAVGDLVDRRTRSPRGARSASQGPIHRRHRDVLCRLRGRRQDDPDALRLVAYHGEVGSLGTGVVQRCWQDLGHELGDGVQPRRVTGATSRRGAG